LQYGFQRRGCFVVVVVVADVVVAVVACFEEWSLMSRNVPFQMTKASTIVRGSFFSRKNYGTKYQFIRVLM
jgi:hypothetical protein